MLRSYFTTTTRSGTTILNVAALCAPIIAVCALIGLHTHEAAIIGSLGTLTNLGLFTLAASLVAAAILTITTRTGGDDQARRTLVFAAFLAAWGVLATGTGTVLSGITTNQDVIHWVLVSGEAIIVWAFLVLLIAIPYLNFAPHDPAQPPAAPDVEETDEDNQQVHPLGPHEKRLGYEDHTE